jgi:hypothetical protein
LNDEIRERFERIKAITQTPEYQANVARMAIEREERQKHYAEKARVERLEELGIQPEHWPFLDAPRPSAAITSVAAFMHAPIDPKGAILVLGGAGGFGKSFAAALAVYAHGGRVAQAKQLPRASLFDTAAWTALERVKLLVIDDLGTEAKDEQDWLSTKFFGLIDARLARKTVITTNLAGPAFMERYASGPLQRLRRRFAECGRFEPLTSGIEAAVPLCDVHSVGGD